MCFYISDLHLSVGDAQSVVSKQLERSSGRVNLNFVACLWTVCVRCASCHESNLASYFLGDFLYVVGRINPKMLN